jgi:PAS domain S-box-containing protein
MSRYMRTDVPHIIGIGREVDARRKDGSVFPVFLSVGRVQGSDPPRFIGLLHDITLRREAMAAIRRERDRANMYLEMAQVILVALSADHRVQLINRKGCDTLGRRELDLLGRNWLEVAIAPEHHDAVLDQFAALGLVDSPDERYFEHEVHGAEGPPRLIAWRAIAMRGAEGRLTGFFASGEDITGRRAMEQSVHGSSSTRRRIWPASAISRSSIRPTAAGSGRRRWAASLASGRARRSVSRTTSVPCTRRTGRSMPRLGRARCRGRAPEARRCASSLRPVRPVTCRRPT